MATGVEKRVKLAVRNTPDGHISLTADAISFLARHKLAVLATSVLLLIPCFWHQRIEAGDLGSHVYNAWLAELIQNGKAPGLFLSHQWNNVLFDSMLSRMAALFGYVIAERICVSVSVLIFFWGGFGLTAAFVRRAPWFLVPILAMLSYGWTFNMGFFNFYLSLGVAFVALAVMWRGRRLDFAGLIILLPLMWLAHPLGLAFFAATGTYVGIARITRRRWHVLLVVAAVGGAATISHYVTSHYEVYRQPSTLYRLNGFDQVAIFNDSYQLIAALFAASAAGFLLVEAIRCRGDREFFRGIVVPMQLYFVVWVTLVITPDTVILPQYAAPVAFVAKRLSLALAMLGCCMLAAIKPRLWHVTTFAAMAVIFFTALFLDTATMNEMEQQAEKLVSELPAGQRVVNMGILLPGSGWPMWHVADRSCIGRCFIYSNYEPASEQFRVRAIRGNGIVVTESQSVEKMQFGEYVVSEREIPVYGVTPCPEDSRKVCGRMLKAGERNGAP